MRAIVYLEVVKNLRVGMQVNPRYLFASHEETGAHAHNASHVGCECLCESASQWMFETSP